jgi:hypothetical protein
MTGPRFPPPWSVEEAKLPIQLAGHAKARILRLGGRGREFCSIKADHSAQLLAR